MMRWGGAQLLLPLGELYQELLVPFAGAGALATMYSADMGHIHC